MNMLVLLSGVLFLIVGWLYIYRLKIIFRINQLIKNTIINDAFILMQHRKIGLMFILIAVLLLYFGFSRYNIK